jgi:hypothetical protein
MAEQKTGGIVIPNPHFDGAEEWCSSSPEKGVCQQQINALVKFVPSSRGGARIRWLRGKVGAMFPLARASRLLLLWAVCRPVR